MKAEPQYIAWKPPSYDPKVASTRIRCLNPLAELQSTGYPVELFTPKRVKYYKAVVYSKCYDDPSYHEAVAFKKRGIRIVFDLCDNHFYNPKGLQHWREAGEKLRRMMSVADYLVASTETMAEMMSSELLDSRRITVIGDAVEGEIEGLGTLPWQRWYHNRQLARLLRLLETERKQGYTQLVWFGNHGSPYAEGGMLDLLKIRAILEQLNCNYSLSLTVISNSRSKYKKSIHPWSIPTHYLEWYADTFLLALKAHFIVVIPISLNPFTVCKSNNRLTISLHHGLAVVADSIPSYQSFNKVCCLDDWETGLKSYLSHPELCRSHVSKGQAMIAKEWSVAHISDKWRNLFSML